MSNIANSQDEISRLLLTVISQIEQYTEKVEVLISKANDPTFTQFAEKSEQAFQAAERLLQKFDELYGMLNDESLYKLYQQDVMGKVRDMIWNMGTTLRQLNGGWYSTVTRILPLTTPILLYTQKDLVKFYWGGAPETSSEASKPEEPTSSDDSNTPTGPETPPEPSRSTETQKTDTPGPSSEEADMVKLHGSFDPNSPVDQQKLQMYRKAKQQLGSSASFPDLARVAYKLQYGNTGTYNKSMEPTKSRRQKGTPTPTAPVTPGQSIYFVRVGPGNYRPAVNADLTSGQQLFVRNPNKLARAVYPFIKMQNAPVRRADLPR